MSAFHRSGGGVAVATFVVLAPFAMACSSGAEAKVDFARSYRAELADFRFASEEVKEQGELAQSVESLDQIVATYDELLQATDEALDGFDDLNPPEDFAAAHEDLVRSLDEQVQALEELVASAEDRDVAGVSQAAGQLAQMSTDFDEARQQLERLIAECDECSS